MFNFHKIKSQSFSLRLSVPFVDVFQLNCWSTLDRALFITVLHVSEVIRGRLLRGPLQIDIQLLDDKLINPLAKRFRGLFALLLLDIEDSRWDSFDPLGIVFILVLIGSVVELVLDRFVRLVTSDILIPKLLSLVLKVLEHVDQRLVRAFFTSFLRPSFRLFLQLLEDELVLIFTELIFEFHSESLCG